MFFKETKLAKKNPTNIVKRRHFAFASGQNAFAVAMYLLTLPLCQRNRQLAMTLRFVLKFS